MLRKTKKTQRVPKTKIKTTEQVQQRQQEITQYALPNHWSSQRPYVGMINTYLINLH